ncbi:hypothetical protein [Streptomyces morookaense]|uniref:Uncharacterized protein n=1 Tax=Streptomyces morookaense TaxID=1970 RepID=A0A7Y7E6Q9_STRMO|nr:hypothetical protein [Streptomyces morookaense]NVK77417.1 hypothetical protein [Streptomyces morookaense]
MRVAHPGAYYAELHGWNERTLLARIEQAVQDGELTGGTDAAALTGLVQSVVHGLSVQAGLGADREDLLVTAHLAHELIRKCLPSATA